MIFTRLLNWEFFLLLFVDKATCWWGVAHESSLLLHHADDRHDESSVLRTGMGPQNPSRQFTPGNHNYVIRVGSWDKNSFSFLPKVDMSLLLLYESSVCFKVFNHLSPPQFYLTSHDHLQPISNFVFLVTTEAYKVIFHMDVVPTCF